MPWHSVKHTPKVPNTRYGIMWSAERPLSQSNFGLIIKTSQQLSSHSLNTGTLKGFFQKNSFSTYNNITKNGKRTKDWCLTLQLGSDNYWTEDSEWMWSSTLISLSTQDGEQLWSSVSSLSSSLSLSLSPLHITRLALPTPTPPTSHQLVTKSVGTLRAWQLHCFDLNECSL